MITQEYFYHGTTKKIIALFGAIFSGIEIVKTPDDDSIPSEKFVVPIYFAPTQKYFIKNELSDQENYIRKFPLPFMSYDLDSINYEPEKKSAAQQRVYNKKPFKEGYYLAQYVPSPYALSFTLSIYSKYKNDVFQIIEQIIPYFTPTLFFNIEIIEEMDNKDIAVTLNGINIESNYSEGFDSVTYHTCTMSFTVNTYYYGAIFKEKFIKKIQSNFLLNPDVDSYMIYGK